MQMISLKKFRIIVQVFWLVLIPISFDLLSAEAKTHFVREGETLYSIAKKYGISVSLIQSVNQLKDPSIIDKGLELTIPQVHLVELGDTIYSISKRFNVEVEQILEVNKINNPSVVRVGAMLFIPENKQTTLEQDSRTVLSKDTSPQQLETAQEDHRFWPLVGSRKALTGKLNGVVITGKNGATVHSVSSGVVRWASTSRGFGKVVLVQNSLGYVYGYLGNSEILVSVGETVNIGTEIGKLGLNSSDNKANLYFLVFKDGLTSDPLLAPRV